MSLLIAGNTRKLTGNYTAPKGIGKDIPKGDYDDDVSKPNSTHIANDFNKYSLYFYSLSRSSSRRKSLIARMTTKKEGSSESSHQCEKRMHIARGCKKPS